MIEPNSPPNVDEKPDFAYLWACITFGDAHKTDWAALKLGDIIWNDYVIPARKRIEELEKENDYLIKTLSSMMGIKKHEI